MERPGPSRRMAMAGAAALLATKKAESEEVMRHVALLGDSVIDNKAYVGGSPDVTEQLLTLVPKGWRVTKLAGDGAMTSGVMRQLNDVPKDATHIVMSVGGNDALQQSGILDAPARSFAEVLF